MIRMVDTVISLITPQARQQDANGIWRTVGETSREVFAQMDTVNRREFFAAGEAGFRPEYKFTVAAIEYAGEAVCAHDGKRYAIYRTYHLPGTDTMELYVQREAGVHSGSQDAH